MSACLAAMIVLAVMSLFSAKYRVWAKEAFDCVGRRLTLRPCRTGFNDKVKATVTSMLMGRSPKTARLTIKHFEAISWIFTIILFVSLAFTAYAIYNLAVYGTCDPTDPDSCVFNPDLPVCGDPECMGLDHCLCDGVGVHCTEDIYEQCNGDCTCICDALAV